MNENMMDMIDNDIAPDLLQSCIPDIGLSAALDPKSTFGLFAVLAMIPRAAIRYITPNTIPCNNKDE